MAQDKASVSGCDTVESTSSGAPGCVQFSFNIAESSLSPKFTDGKKDYSLIRYASLRVTIMPLDNNYDNPYSI